MNTETLNQWVQQYETKKTLPSKKIPCSTEGCKTETTCFSNNLTSRVEKATNVRSFLSTFKCRSCKKDTKQAANKRTLSAELKEGIEALRANRVKAATVIVETNEVSTEDILNVFAEV